MTTEDAIAYYGTRKKLAKALGCHLMTTYKNAWKPCPPAGRQYQIEVLTKGKLKAEKEPKP